MLEALKKYHEMNFFTQIILGAFFMYAAYRLAIVLFGGFAMFLQIAAAIVAVAVLGCLGAVPLVSSKNKILAGANWLINLIPEAVAEQVENMKDMNEEAKQQAQQTQTA